ncbi:peptide ABC transporter substrate-binding protein [Nocardia pseudobrasiliensis]|uniref:Oligopeptide transport system substrate-binding protein n=1 Tax=Nocardia pseudobrasiliensis TaxID=45979 RepID=A0A370I9C7_9NOCA|nr:ABC transporter substrate-binding protein [Nocardia pseudobrasiliensis]RDI66014.1 oligopeptide transport system substrate-binding protein [Nocardia pseudobrasiliensis]
MRFKTITALSAAALLATSLALTGCSSSGGNDADIVTVNGGEPQHPLVPTNTNENMGGRVVDRLFAGLKYYDADGKAYNEVAQSIESTDRQHYKITLKDWKFTDGTPVTAKSFVNAWNYGALGTNGQVLNWAFTQIAGYDDVAANPPKAQTMSGLKVIDDKTFTIDLKSPSIDFELELGYSPFYPLPDAAYKDMQAFGENPVGNGPYKMAGSGAWQHNVKIDLVPSEDYHGGRPPKNKGLRFVMYQSYDTAYADLLAGNLDALDIIPDSQLGSYQKDLGDRAMTKPIAYSQHIGIQQTVPHFGGAEGVLRRKAISMAINREQIAQNIFHGTRVPSQDFTAFTLPGFRKNLPGSELLKYNPDEAKKLWAQADAMSPWSGRYEIAYNADGGHQAWVEAVANSVKNTFGVDAVGVPFPTFKTIRDAIQGNTIGKAFRYGWQGDYPSMFEFLTSLYLTGSGTNNTQHNDPEFDGLLAKAQAAATPEQAYDILAQAQGLLFRDMADIPIFDYNVAAGRSDKVKKAEVTWSGLFDFENIEK